MFFFNIQILSSFLHVALKNIVTACKITLYSHPVSNTWFEDSTNQKFSSYNPENFMYPFHFWYLLMESSAFVKQKILTYSVKGIIFNKTQEQTTKVQHLNSINTERLNVSALAWRRYT